MNLLWSRLPSQLLALASKARRRLEHAARIATNRVLAVAGHRNYVKFIVLTRSRTGSNLLLSFLNSHPNVFSEGEIFARLHGTDPLRRLAQVFAMQPLHLCAKGFKIFYYHPLDADGSALWDALVRDNDVRVIHLTRQNVLRTLLSRRIAEISDSWTGTQYDRASGSDKRVHLDPNELEEGFRQTAEWERKAASQFRGHPVLQVTYEQLVRFPHETNIELQDFLGASRHEAQTKLNQQNPESLRELVSNYDALKARFAGSAWSPYFED